MKKIDIKMTDILSNPEYIFIVDKNGIRRKVSIIEAQAIFGIKWLEWNTKKDYFSNIDINKVIEKFEIRYMGDKLGWGVFARKKFYKGDYIGVFTGEINRQSIHQPVISEYAFNYPCDDNVSMIVIDATNIGNIIRFIQHLPNNKDLENYEFNPPEIRSDVAVGNIDMEIVFLKNGLKTLRFFASKDIDVGEIIGCVYIGKIWFDQPVFFKKYDGAILNAKFITKINSQS